MSRAAAAAAGKRPRAASAAARAAAATPVDATPAPARPPRRTHAERREEAERRLLDAALAIVAQRGSLRMTLADVAHAAGYSRGLPSHRFGSKAGLVHALAGYIGEQFGEQRQRLSARAPAPAPGLDAISANIHFYFSRKGGAWTATRALLVMMSEACMEPAAPLLRKELAAYNRGALAWFEAHIRAGVANGDIAPGTDATATAVLLLGAMRGTMLQWLVDRRIRLPAVRDRLLQIVDAALRQQRAPPTRIHHNPGDGHGQPDRTGNHAGPAARAVAEPPRAAQRAEHRAVPGPAGRHRARRR